MNRLWNAVKYFYYGLQFAVAIIMPFIVCIMLGNWLSERFGLGDWVMVLSIVIAFLLAAADVYSLGRFMLRILSEKEDKHNEQNDKK